jgi:HAD superfamily hydrolase (TIGR01509 family)
MQTMPSRLMRIDRQTMEPSPTLPWPVRCVVFDLDGLLVDTEPIFEEATRRLLARRGLVLVAEAMQAMMGTPARQALVSFRRFYTLSDTDDELLAEAREHFFDHLGETPAPLLPGVWELLDRLDKKGLPKAIATSSTAVYVQQILQPHQLLHRFDFVLTAEDVRLGKPFPEVYQKAAARFGHEPANMVVLEDSPNGLRAAKAAGARCIVVPHDRVPRHELDGADAIVPSLAAPELAEMLGI